MSRTELHMLENQAMAAIIKGGSPAAAQLSLMEMLGSFLVLSVAIKRVACLAGPARPHRKGPTGGSLLDIVRDRWLSLMGSQAIGGWSSSRILLLAVVHLGPTIPDAHFAGIYLLSPVSESTRPRLE